MWPVHVSRNLSLPTESTLLTVRTSRDNRVPVYLCMASLFQASSLDALSGHYVQGAGDDSEGWAHGLTASLYWTNREELAHTAEDELPVVMERLVREDSTKSGDGSWTPVSRDGRILLGPIPHCSAGVISQGALLIVCAATVEDALVVALGARLLHLSCGANKVGSRDLRVALNKVPPFVVNRTEEVKIHICDATGGTDLAVGTALVLLCLQSDIQGSLYWLPRSLIVIDSNLGMLRLASVGSRPAMDKTVIRRKLSGITTLMVSANPSRATLNAVNSFLMKPG